MTKATWAPQAWREGKSQAAAAPGNGSAVVRQPISTRPGPLCLLLRWGGGQSVLGFQGTWGLGASRLVRRIRRDGKRAARDRSSRGKIAQNTGYIKSRADLGRPTATG